jgi:predicted transcriptional regulator
MRVEEVANELGVSKPYAYKLVQKLNEELKRKNFITISGRVSKQYFQERIYGLQAEKERSK